MVTQVWEDLAKKVRSHNSVRPGLEMLHFLDAASEAEDGETLEPFEARTRSQEAGAGRLDPTASAG
eukprot:480219-Pleurochrysis_carterae.AAC.1